jgi:3-methyladenine DNA glycosylase Mpg
MLREAARNAMKPMFGAGGTFYIYRCYGLHWMLSVVTGPIDYPAAVLIRSIDGIVESTWDYRRTEW